MAAGAGAAAAATAASAEMKPSAALSGEAELAERKGTWKYEAPAAAKPAAKKKSAAKKPAAKASADKATADKSASKKPAAKKAAPKKAAAKKSVAKSDAQVDYDGDGKFEGTNEGTRPAALDGPRGGNADDLKQIKGIGPKMEKLCNSLGFYHFDQIAAWSPDEVAWVDANLEGFKGRVTRDTWVEQAKILAAGGDTEFSKRVEDGGVY